jgi:hypothetical protein
MRAPQRPKGPLPQGREVLALVQQLPPLSWADVLALAEEAAAIGGAKNITVSWRATGWGRIALPSSLLLERLTPQNPRTVRADVMTFLQR